MGYRSTFITNDFYEEIPDWFVKKYQGQLNFGERDGKPAAVIASKWERKFYGLEEDELFEDIARVASEIDISFPIDGALVHEDGLVTAVHITPTEIKVEHLDGNGINPQLGDGGTRELATPPIKGKEPTHE